MDQLDVEDAHAAAGTAEQQVTSLYQAHALSLARLALVMLGDASAAEDVVQDAFLGLYRRWESLADPAAAQSYLRTSVLNGCRTALRRRSRHGVLTDSADSDDDAFAGPTPAAESAEATVVHGEEHRAVLAAIRRLPARQREALVLRYFLDLTEDQTADAMQVSRGTVKSATSRAIAAVGRMLGVPVTTNRLPPTAPGRAHELGRRSGPRRHAGAGVHDAPGAAAPTAARPRRGASAAARHPVAPVAGMAGAGHRRGSRHRDRRLAGDSQRSLERSRGSTRSTGSAASVPPYYVTLTQQADENAHTSLAATRYDLVVGNAHTGKQLATLAPPNGSTFFGVTAAADDRTFVVDTLPVGKSTTRRRPVPGTCSSSRPVPPRPPG